MIRISATGALAVAPTIDTTKNDITGPISNLTGSHFPSGGDGEMPSPTLSDGQKGPYLVRLRALKRTLRKSQPQALGERLGTQPDALLGNQLGRCIVHEETIATPSQQITRWRERN
jgi:hypothetical protein